jgi:hypothetical protein
MNWHRQIEVITPLFNRGAYQDIPEVRPPSIRGMVRWWFRALGGRADDEKQAFGGMTGLGNIHREAIMASSVVFRVSGIQARPAPGKGVPTLPHKQGGPASPKAAFLPGARFRLEVFSRFAPLPRALEQSVSNALEVWLLLGALGLRANRSGGSVWPVEAAPATPEELRERLDRLGCRWPVMLAGSEVGSTEEALRAASTDTVNGAPWVFGYAKGQQRLGSALKFKVVRLGGVLRLIAFAPDSKVLEEARRALQGHRCLPETWKEL